MLGPYARAGGWFRRRSHGEMPTGRLAQSSLLLGASALALFALGRPATARADNCDPYRQICVSTGEYFCGGDRIAGCLHSECCPDAGCCLTMDQFGVSSAGCCPSGPDYEGVCNNGQCQETCKNPCGPNCCLASLGEVCDPKTNTCCPVAQVCGLDTSSPSCCSPPNVCTPAGTCCAAGDVCGNDCCPAGYCCNGQCCNAGSACYGDRVCCPQSSKPCGDTCCSSNERCLKRKRKPPVCKCKRRGRKCGGTHCCVGDVCLDGVCVPPLPR